MARLSRHCNDNCLLRKFDASLLKGASRSIRQKVSPALRQLPWPHHLHFGIPAWVFRRVPRKTRNSSICPLSPICESTRASTLQHAPTQKSSFKHCFRVECRVVDLITLLSRPEGKTLEFKRDLSSPEGALKAIVAFANTSGGILVLGVEDGTKKIKGVPNILAEEERLANLIADSISPRLVPSIEVMPWRKTQVLAVEVYPSASRPHYLNRLGPEEGAFVRVGSTNRRADHVLIEEMRRYNQVSSFDEQPQPELNSEAIDFRAASEYLRPILKTYAVKIRIQKRPLR